MNGYCFLFDRDVQAAADALPRRRVLTPTKFGLPDNASDAAIVETASVNECIIVTANGNDFVREALRYISQSSRKSDGCHDLNGLVILPSGLEVQRRLLRNAEKRMRFDGLPVTWADVWTRSYCVRLKKDGSAEVRLLPRCLYCNDMTLRRRRRSTW